MNVRGHDVRTTSWTVCLEGDALAWRTESTTDPVRVVTPWIKRGYVTSDPRIVFTHFLDDHGLFRPAHQFKRRAAHQIPADRWVDMATPLGFDVRFESRTAGGLNLVMDENEMRIAFHHHDSMVRVRPAAKTLPDIFPQFFSSKHKVDKVLNEFLLSHGFNFGVGTPRTGRSGRRSSWTGRRTRSATCRHAPLQLRDER